MHIKDQILKILAETGSADSSAVAKRLDVSDQRIIHEVNEICQNFPYWIQKGNGYGDSLHRLMIRDKASVQGFLEEGGFTKVHQSRQAELEQKVEQQKREALLSELQIKELLRLPEEAKGTRKLSWTAIGVSTATLLFEVAKAIFS
jgi:hypothetical protein